MSAARTLCSLLLAVALSACVFRLPTVQGNVIEQEQVNQLEIGMTAEQVRYLIGTPLVQGSFDPNRWDYVYYFRSSRGEVTQRSLNLYFENERLARIVGQEAPGGATAVGESGSVTAPEQAAEDPTPLPGSSVGTSAEEEEPIPLP